MSGKLFGYARVSVASDAEANNLENQRRVLADWEQVFEDVGSGASWNRPGLNRLKAALQPGDCVKVAALDRMGRSLTEVLELLGWLRENGVEIISLRESIDQDSAMGRAMLHLAIVFVEMERDLARERTPAGEVEVMVDEFPQAQVLGEGGRKDQSGIGHQAVVVKDDADPVGVIAW